MNWKKKLFNFFKFSSNDYYFVCLDCGIIIDNKREEIFIKHQFAKNHYNVKKVERTKSFRVDFDDMADPPFVVFIRD